MFCQKCGKMIKESASYCPYCGDAVLQNVEIIEEKQKFESTRNYKSIYLISQMCNINAKLKKIKNDKIREVFDRHRLLIITSIILLLAIIGSVLFIVNKGDNVKMPKLIGKSVSEAESILKENGFINYSIDFYEKEDIVVEQSIKENVKVNNHDELILKSKEISEIFEGKILDIVEDIVSDYGWKLNLFDVALNEISIDDIKDKKLYEVTKILNYENENIILEIDTTKHLKELEEKEEAKQKKKEEEEKKEEEIKKKKEQEREKREQEKRKEEERKAKIKSDAIDEVDAWNFFETVLESRCRYGCECHWFMKLYNSTQNEDGSWKIKVGVSIKNAYGVKYDAIAEGTVTADGKEVKNLLVY